MANVQAGKLYTHTMTNKAKRVITSVFANKSDVTVTVEDKDFTFAEGENYILCPKLDRIPANVAFVGVSFQNLSIFGMPTEVAANVATALGAERTAKQEKLYGA